MAGASGASPRTIRSPSAGIHHAVCSVAALDISLAGVHSELDVPPTLVSHSHPQTSTVGLFSLRSPPRRPISSQAVSFRWRSLLVLLLSAWPRGTL